MSILTHDSLNAHGILTARLPYDSHPEGKGRGREEEGRVPLWSPSIHPHLSNARAARPAAPLAVAGSSDGWMANSSSPVITPERRDGQPHPAERLAVACPSGRADR